jgi:hypothetical protein
MSKVEISFYTDNFPNRWKLAGNSLETTLRETLRETLRNGRYFQIIADLLFPYKIRNYPKLKALKT